MGKNHFAADHFAADHFACGHLRGVGVVAVTLPPCPYIPGFIGGDVDVRAEIVVGEEVQANLSPLSVTTASLGITDPTRPILVDPANPVQAELADQCK